MCLLIYRLLTPVPALVCSCLIAVFQVIVFDIRTLIHILSFASWIFYGGSFLSLIILRFRVLDKVRRPFKVWLIVPIICLLMSIYIVLTPLIVNPSLQYLYVSIFLVIGSIVYVCFVQFQVKLEAVEKLNQFAIDKLGLSPTERDPLHLVN